MFAALKKINKKFLYVIGAIFGVIILIIIIVAIVRACSGPGNNYKKVEDQLVKAATKYFNSEGQKLPEKSESAEVTADELVEGKFMKPMEKLLADASCKGSVRVFNNGGEILYVPDLNCTDYKTQHLADKIKEDQLIASQQESTTTEEASNSNVSSNDQIETDTNIASNSNTNEPIIDDGSDDYPSGLYEMDDGYFVFRGKKPNNYVTFGGLEWRIIDIDPNGIIRIVRSEPESKVIYWDTKFNSDAGKAYGINDYKNSYILEKMNEDYSKFKKENKLHLSPFSVCVGKREINQVAIDRNIDCSEILENQYIAIVSSSDFARASLDESCKKITDAACSNYNYLSGVLTQTWTTTGLKRSTYEVIYINNGTATGVNARRTNFYNRVIAFNGYELYGSGNGTAKKPYELVMTTK